MVRGVADLRRRLQRVPKIINDELRAEIAKVANEIVRGMRAANPYPQDIQIAWTWGNAPAGAVTLAQTAGGSTRSLSGGMRATIYATSRTLETARVPILLARVVEFGTGPRRQRSTGRYAGVMPAQPFFFPVFRANRSRARGSVARAFRRAVRKA